MKLRLGNPDTNAELTPRTVVAVEVGGLVVKLNIADAILAGHTRRRYEHFLADNTTTSHLEIDVDYAHLWFHKPATSPRVELVGPSQFELSYGALQASVNLGIGRGRAECPSSVYVLDSLIRISLTMLGLEHDALLLHSCGFVGEEGAVVCFGPSGVGKSTVARSVEPNAVLCDEIIFLSLKDGKVHASGTPFHGDYDVCAPLKANVRSLVRLRQSKKDNLTEMSPGQAISTLLGCTLFFCANEALGKKLLDLAARITEQAGVSILDFKQGTHVPTFLQRHDFIRASADAARQGVGPASVG